MSELNAPNDPYAALRIPEFRSFVTARFCFTLAMQIQAVVVGWQIYDLTKDPLALGMIGLVEVVPSIAVALYAGHLADLTSRKKIIILCNLILILCSLFLFTYSFDPQNLLVRLGVLPIYLVIFLSGCARGFVGPAVFSFMPQLLPAKTFYANAVSWNTTVWQAGSVLGPAVGGLVYGFFGISAAYSADLFLIAFAFVCFSLIGAKPLPETAEKLPIKESLLSGVRFVFGNQIILSAITLDLFAVLFGGAVALLPVFAADILDAGPQGFGFLRAAPAIGSIVTAFYLAHHPLGRNAGRKMLWAVAGFGVCMILFGVSRSFYLSLGLLFLSGMFDCVSMIVRQTLMQTLTPEHLKGRVSAVTGVFIGSSNEIGSFESGLAARLLGVTTSVVFGGAITLLVVGATAIRADKLRKLQF
ncbi:MAG: MFS transporter [Acidobacteria bacterium]|nr:MFS transporter [Acidobacteriota bacterium]